MTCELHDWNQPCHACIADEYMERDRMGRRAMLGKVGGSLIPLIAAKLREEWPLKRLKAQWTAQTAF